MPSHDTGQAPPQLAQTMAIARVRVEVVRGLLKGKARPWVVLREDARKISGKDSGFELRQGRGSRPDHFFAIFACVPSVSHCSRIRHNEPWLEGDKNDQGCAEHPSLAAHESTSSTRKFLLTGPVWHLVNRVLKEIGAVQPTT